MVFTDVKAILRRTQHCVKMSVFCEFQTKLGVIINMLMQTCSSIKVYFFLDVNNKVGS